MNTSFWQILTNVKIRKTKIWGLEKLKMCKCSQLKMFFTIVEERILSIYKSLLFLSDSAVWLF